MDDNTTDEAVLKNDMIITAVGVIKNDLSVPPLIAGEDGLKHNTAYDSSCEKLKETPGKVSEIVLANRFVDLLEGIEEYSHIIVLYWGHEVPDAGRKLTKIHPAGLTDYPEKGIFATCSPARPNPILMTVVRLLEREGNRLIVRGLDAIDKSPVLDIKPYVAEMYPQDGVLIPDWMARIMKEFGENPAEKRKI